MEYWMKRHSLAYNCTTGIWFLSDPELCRCLSFVSFFCTIRKTPIRIKLDHCVSCIRSLQYSNRFSCGKFLLDINGLEERNNESYTQTGLCYNWTSFYQCVSFSSESGKKPRTVSQVVFVFHLMPFISFFLLHHQTQTTGLNVFRESLFIPISLRLFSIHLIR